jgi:cation diffusion facilitator CzcD-associated flavoprotein CzcO
MTDIAVIGAGPAGVSVALSLRDRGLSALLIERGDHVGSSWRGRYDRLKLNTGRPFSHLPNRPYPRGTAMFPTRDDVVAHLDRHAHESGIELRLGTEVTRIDRQATRWRLETSTGDIDARQVVVANGNQHTPRIPEWPGEFMGEVLHSSAYRNPGPYQGKNVLVVGGGSSGMEIAHDLATAARPRSGWRCGPRRTSCCGRFPVACRAIWSPSRYIAPPSVSPTRSAGRRAARTSAT